MFVRLVEGVDDDSDPDIAIFFGKNVFLSLANV